MYKEFLIKKSVHKIDLKSKATDVISTNLCKLCVYISIDTHVTYIQHIKI